MNIFFRGLIAHVKVDNRDISRAVLVREASHVPKLIIKDSDIDGNPTFPRLFGAPAGETWFNLSGQEVRVRGLPAGPTIRQPLFISNVPALPSVLYFDDTHKLDDDIHGNRLHRSAATYIDLTGGSLDVSDCFIIQAIFDHPQQDDPACVAKHVVYSAPEFPNIMTFVGNNGVSVDVKATADVNVSNTSGGGIHFHMFLELAADHAKGIRDIHPNAGHFCSRCVPTIEPNIFNADVECTNSHWP